MGKEPLFLDLLKLVIEREGVELSGVLWDPATDQPVGQWLDKMGIPAAELRLLRNVDEAARTLRTWNADYLFNYNSTVILDGALLRVPTYGALNLHPGLLPEYAGLHTHQWAIRNGEPEFGATLHWMETRVDAGDIALHDTFELTERDTGFTTYMKCLRTCRRLVGEAITLLVGGCELPRIAQDMSRRHLYKDADARDGLIDWHLTDRELIRFFRAADYGPFQSPTYRPTTICGDQEIVLENATAGTVSGEEPGTVVRVDKELIEVVCGNGRTLVCSVKEAVHLIPQRGDVLIGRNRTPEPDLYDS